MTKSFLISYGAGFEEHCAMQSRAGNSKTADNLAKKLPRYNCSCRLSCLGLSFLLPARRQYGQKANVSYFLHEKALFSFFCQPDFLIFEKFWTVWSTENATKESLIFWRGESRLHMGRYQNSLHGIARHTWTHPFGSWKFATNFFQVACCVTVLAKKVWPSFKNGFLFQFC